MTFRKGGTLWPWLITGTLAVTGLVLAAVALAGARDFSPGENLYASSVGDIAASDESALYPPSDVVRFEEAPRTVYVYLAVEELPEADGLTARVEHAGTGTLLSRFAFGGERIKVTEQGEGQLSPDDGGVSGVLRFAIEPGEGATVPEGDYTVGVYRDGALLAQKRFSVGV